MMHRSRSMGSMSQSGLLAIPEHETNHSSEPAATLSPAPASMPTAFSHSETTVSSVCKNPPPNKSSHTNSLPENPQSTGHIDGLAFKVDNYYHQQSGVANSSGALPNANSSGAVPQELAGDGNSTVSSSTGLRRSLTRRGIELSSSLTRRPWMFRSDSNSSLLSELSEDDLGLNLSKHHTNHSLDLSSLHQQQSEDIESAGEVAPPFIKRVMFQERDLLHDITSRNSVASLAALCQPEPSHIAPPRSGTSLAAHLPLSGLLATTSRRSKILALCGAKSNNEMTRLQLENLHVTPDRYDIVYLHGNIEEEEGGEGVAGLVHGPFYSWIDSSGDNKAIDENFVNSVRLVLRVASLYGPFDTIYGFSNGGLVAILAANIASDSRLSAAITMTPQSTSRHCKRKITSDWAVINDCAGASIGEGFLWGSKELREPVRIRGKPFSAVICACAGLSVTHGLESITSSDLGSHISSATNAEHGIAGLVDVPSIHLVGIEDPLKTRSEALAKLLIGGKVFYLPGGHGIERNESHDEYLIDAIKNLIVSPEYTPLMEHTRYKHVNAISSISVHPKVQVSRNRLRRELLPSGKLPGGATILSCLQSQPSNKPFLFNARDSKGANTTYGQVLNFIQGGEGDLRRLGVSFGEVVAYGTPPGGGAAAALAFLCVGAQTTAAPLAPGMTEPEVLDALDQFQVKHLILFEDVHAPGIKDAFEKYTSDGYGKLHHARMLGADKPGQFEFTSKQVTGFASLSKLANPETGRCLLLRTSGTTARPKGVPLLQGDLVDNGAMIAASLRLLDTDVCYSIMPLFHIGGISASILCTMTSGGSVCCDGESFDPIRMVDALAVSNPQPTWYSSVPTIHNATVAFLKENAGHKMLNGYGVNRITGVWKKGHSLRMIRSGAAALLSLDAEALSKTYGGIPIYPSYSMSEQMPIASPPAGMVDTVTKKPGSVGVPIAVASLAIVSRTHFRPQPYGSEGEIAISGDTVMGGYLQNPEADAKSYFLLNQSPGQSVFFLTGDVGVMDQEGYLFIKGRAKELIKKGGEQVSPYEVEGALLDHPWVKTAVCFSVPSKVYGEEVGCAIVLTSDTPLHVKDKEVIKLLREFMRENKFSPIKWPTKWRIGFDDDLPKTKSGKYIRVGLAEQLGLGEDEVITEQSSKETKAEIDWQVIAGFRFILACYVMFMHLGSNESWGHLNNLRGWPWHVHCFYTLGGFSMASPMNPVIKKKFSYFLARIGNMYSMYMMALIFGLANLLVVCRPSTFDPNFHWDGQPGDDNRGFFCEGTPLTKTSWWWSLILTIVTYIFGLAVTPFWPVSWWLGYYLWFSSMYYQCLAIFPAMYNYLFTQARKNIQRLLQWMAFLQVFAVGICVAAWFCMKSSPSYNNYDSETGDTNPSSKHGDEDGSAPAIYNVAILSFYLFAPFWAIYFVIGGVLAFIYDAYKPNERHNAQIWGHIADVCSLIQVAIGVAIVCQPVYNDPDSIRWFRPSDADYIGDSSAVNRLWDCLCGRIMAPLTTLWIFALSTGKGYTASILRSDFLVHTLSPNSYNCFLFHQMVGQWYYAVTRPGQFWNWWQFRKQFYWFSPGPCPVEWYEFFQIVFLVVIFSQFMENTFVPMLKNIAGKAIRLIREEEEDEDINVMETLCRLIEKMTGIEPEKGYTLDEVGLASVGLPVIVTMINSSFSTSKNPITVSPAELIGAKTIEDIAIVIEGAMARVEHNGV